MNRSRFAGRFFILFTLILAGATHLHAQANVNESLETAFYWVDAVNGSNSNPGTQQLPFQTIGYAMSIAIQNNEQGIGTMITVNPGTYRESINLTTNQNMTNLPITVQAATAGTAIVSGADVWTGWQPWGNNPNIYTDPWPYQWGFCSVGQGVQQPPITLREEMIFVNGVSLTQVLSQNQMYYPGTFAVDESGGTVYIWPPTGTDMSQATIEVSTRNPIVSLSGIQEMVFRGMTIQGANSCWNQSAVTVQGLASNILFDTDSFLWNNAAALQFLNPSTNFTVQNSILNHNGQMGGGDYKVKNMLWQNDMFNYNNWRGALGSTYAGMISGAYPADEHDANWNNITAAWNLSNGIQWESDANNVTVLNAVALNNFLSGIFIDKDEGTISITGSSFCNNVVGGPAGTTSVATALLFRNSENVSLSGNDFYNNGNGVLGITGTAGGVTVQNWETGQQYNLVTENMTLSSNIFEADQTNQGNFLDGYLGGSDWTAFQTTLNSDNNDWWNPLQTLTFLLPTPAPNSLTNFQGWQAATGQDPDSTWSQPGNDPPAACQLSPDFPDYWLTLDNGSLTMAADGTGTFNLTATPWGTNAQVNLTLDGISEVPGLSGGLVSQTLNPPATTQVSVSAAPTVPPGSYPLTVLGNNGNNTHAATFLFVVPLTYVRVVPATLSFPQTQVNMPSNPLTAIMTNYGTTPLTISSIIPTAQQFTESDNCNGYLAPGYSCTLSIVYTPNAPVYQTGTVVISDSDPDSPQIINVNGTGVPAPSATLLPASQNFGSVSLGSSGGPLTSTLTNTGAVPVSISGISFTGVDPGDFSEQDNCGTGLPVGGSCAINITFMPTVTGNRSATLVVTDNTPSGGQIVSLSGVGTQVEIQLSTTSLSFGNVNIGSSVQQAFTISNVGNAVLQITSIVISGSNAQDFSESNNCNGQVNPNSSCNVAVVFSPVELGNLTASVVISDNAPASPQTVALSGTGTQPIASFSASSLNFGTVLIDTSATLPLVLTNAGTGTMTISRIYFSGTGAQWFSQTNNCPTSLSPNASCQISVTFAPQALGTFTPALNFSDNAPGSPQSIALSGTGAQPGAALSPPSVAFGEVIVGQSSTPQNVTLTNTGTYPLTNDNIVVTGQDAGDFSQYDNCPGTIAVGGSCTISVTFTPTTTGTRTAFLAVYDNAPNSPQTVSLSGTGITAGLTISPESLAFGNVNIGPPSPPQKVTLSNTGTTSIQFTQPIAITGQNAADYLMATTCGSTLAPGKSCTVTVEFQPTTTGELDADISIYDNLPNSPQEVPLTGFGTQPIVSLSPTSLSFGDQLIDTSASNPVTLTNTGTGTMMITVIKIGGTNAQWFSQTNNCGTQLPANASCQITVTFDPQALGSFTAALVLEDNAPGSPQGVSLSGTGAQPVVALSPKSLAFGSIIVGQSSAPQSSTLTNTGGYALTINSITLAGADPQDYSQSNNCGDSVPPGGSCIITVEFTPTATGSRTAAVAVSDNAPGNPQTISLSGTGVTTGLSITPSSLSFGDQLLNQRSAAQVIGLTNAGTTTIQFTQPIAITGQNPQDFLMSTTCGATLLPGKSCKVSIAFLPLVLGDLAAQVTITDNLPNSPQQVPISGTGVQPEAQVSPTSIDFGDVPVNTPSNPQAVTLTNVGTGQMGLGAITLSGTNAGWFSKTTTCGSTLGVGQSCTVTIVATPKTKTTGTATLNIKDNAPGSPQQVSLSVTGD